MSWDSQKKARLAELETRGQNHVDTTGRKDGHGRACESGIGAVKGLIQDDGAIGGHIPLSHARPCPSLRPLVST